MPAGHARRVLGGRERAARRGSLLLRSGAFLCLGCGLRQSAAAAPAYAMRIPASGPAAGLAERLGWA